MNPATSENDVLMPTDLQRKQIFYWLQKVSSLTAWRRVFAHYQAWADATENSVAESEMGGWSEMSSLNRRDLMLVKEGLADFETCATRLAKDGNRKFREIATFNPTSAQKNLWIQAQTVRRVDEGENGINEEHTPLWQEYCEAMASLQYVWMECKMHIFTHHDFSAEFNYYSNRLQKELAHMPFPPHLTAVPEPVEDVIIRANGSTPFTGIWEPVEAPEQTFLSRFSGAWKPSAPFKILGAMCYFEAHSRAPRLRVDTPDGMKKLDMAWRLLWRDDRYSDGVTPEIESTYRFMYPERSLAKRSTDGDGDVIWAESGAAAQSDGKWMLEDTPGFCIMRTKGQRMPFSQGRSGRWILQQEAYLAATATTFIGGPADNSRICGSDSVSAAPFQLSLKQKKHVTLLYHFASLEYLKGLQQRVNSLISFIDPTLDEAKLNQRDEILKDMTSGARNTAEDWASNAWPFLANFQRSISDDIAKRAVESYGITDSNNCARGTAENSQAWIKPEDKVEFQRRMDEIADYAINIDYTMDKNSTGGRWSDFSLTAEEGSLSRIFQQAPTLRLRADVAGKTGDVPPDPASISRLMIHTAHRSFAGPATPQGNFKSAQPSTP